MILDQNGFGKGNCNSKMKCIRQINGYCLKKNSLKEIFAL
jgi:hypothetical protein